MGKKKIQYLNKENCEIEIRTPLGLNFDLNSTKKLIEWITQAQRVINKY